MSARSGAGAEEEVIAENRDRTRINEAIRRSPVCLVDADGGQVGIVPVEQVPEIACSQGLGLVEAAADARPIVCKILNRGRYRGQLEKKAREARGTEHQIEVEEVEFRPAVADHDFRTKPAMARRFLE